MPRARCRARRSEGCPWPRGRETWHRSRLYRRRMRSRTRKARTDRRRPAGPLERHAATPPGADGARAPSWQSRGARRADAAAIARAVPGPSRRRRSARATSADNLSDRPWCSKEERRIPRPGPSRQQRRPPMRRSRERPHRRRRMSTRHVVSALDCPRRQPPPKSRSSLWVRSGPQPRRASRRPASLSQQRNQIASAFAGLCPAECPIADAGDGTPRPSRPRMRAGPGETSSISANATVAVIGAAANSRAQGLRGQSEGHGTTRDRRVRQEHGRSRAPSGSRSPPSWRASSPSPAGRHRRPSRPASCLSHGTWRRLRPCGPPPRPCGRFRCRRAWHRPKGPSKEAAIEPEVPDVSSSAVAWASMMASSRSKLRDRDGLALRPPA